jgi:hypothetical protein
MLVPQRPDTAALIESEGYRWIYGQTTPPSTGFASEWVIASTRRGLPQKVLLLKRLNR